MHARFAGVIRSVSRNVGDTVRAGDALATIESNESLQTYTVTAPIAGTVTARHAAPGEQTDAEALFEIADFSSVWAELDVFARDRPRLATGLRVTVTADTGTSATGSVDYLAPVGNRASQSVTARVVLDNADGALDAGPVRRRRTSRSRTTPVELAVPLSALQRFRDFDVVFARVGDTYEVRMLDARAARRALRRGARRPRRRARTTSPTTATSIKADIEKAGASHDH